MPIGTIADDQGNTRIPEEVREHLHLKKGDRVEYLIGPGSEVRLRPIERPAIIGRLHRPDLPVLSLEEQREAMVESLVEDDERIKRGEE
ncbi:MAG: AbrB/MazE/SpoVT family DNA-binding domain-containing protein [Thermoanaerobaculia bacterium]